MLFLISGCDNEGTQVKKLDQKIHEIMVQNSAYLGSYPDQTETYLFVQLTPDDVYRFKDAITEISKFCKQHPDKRTVLQIDTTKLFGEDISDFFKNAPDFMKSLYIVHYNSGSQDLKRGVATTNFDPVLRLVNKTNMPNLYHFNIALAGDENTILKNAQTLKSSVENDKPDEATVDVTVPPIKDQTIEKTLKVLECEWFKITITNEPWF